MHRILVVLVLVLATAAFSGCATTPNSGSPTSGGNVLSEEDIADASARDAWELLENLRPRWLRSRGSVSLQDPEAGYPKVYVDGSTYGDLDALRSISASDIAEMEFISASQATTRFGTGHAGGVIMITTRR